MLSAFCVDSSANKGKVSSRIVGRAERNGEYIWGKRRKHGRQSLGGFRGLSGHQRTVGRTVAISEGAAGAMRGQTRGSGGPTIGQRGLEGWRGRRGDGIGAVLRRVEINGGRRCATCGWCGGNAGSGEECGGEVKKVVAGAGVVVSIHLST